MSSSAAPACHPPTPLQAWLPKAAQAHPQQQALVAPSGTLSYAQLWEAVSALAQSWRQQGLQPGDRIAIAANRDAITLIRILAAIEAQLAYVPLDTSYPSERIAAMLAQAQVRMTLGDVPGQAAGEHGAQAESIPATAQAPLASNADLRYVLFTSGSTGAPKGVAMGHDPLAHLIDWHAQHSRLGQPCTTLLFAPLSFDVHFQEILSTVACQGTMVLIDESHRRDPAMLRQALQTHQVDRLFLPYVALQMLAEADKDARQEPGGQALALRDVISAGEQLQSTPAIRELFGTLPQAVLHNHYGPTETHVVTAFELPQALDQWPAIPPIGQPLPSVQIALRDPESGAIVRPQAGGANGGPFQSGSPFQSGRQEGELLLGGSCLALGYLGRADLTTERFQDHIPGLPGRWYTTGDLVRQDADGTLTYLGRADQQLKVDGFRIEPGEIEIALMQHPSVQDAVVTAPTMAGVGRQLVAHLVLRPSASAGASTSSSTGSSTGPSATASTDTVDWPALQTQLRQHLRAHLPEYMVPTRFMTLARLPTTPSGKIDRRNLPLPQVHPSVRSSLPSAAASQVSTPGGSQAAAGSSHSQADTGTLLEAAISAAWQDLLGLSMLDRHANVFDLGAKSLLVLRFVARLKEAGIKVSVAQVYDQPTAAGLSALLAGMANASSGPTSASPGRSRRTQATPDGIAIVGMAVRTAGAQDLDTFWANLLANKEGIRHFAPHELDASVPLDLRSRPNFVAARGVLEDADRFDAPFFGISAREAVALDPQQRLFLELCWTALEHASIDPAQVQDIIGVYAGEANNTYTPLMRQAQPELVQQFGEMGVMLGSEKDYIATRVANRLNLTGPAISIHTACSTSLVAITQAWHALASGQCDVALAGGMTVVVPQEAGYLHVEGGMESADGHCRPFDEQASGTLFASGGGVVVLKRLADALAAGDTVYGVIKGVGINNDGRDKASFTAPSVAGQAQAIRMALDHAEVDARSIGYVEAHGTGTNLGDPIEVAALTQAWAADTQDRQFCHLGSVKGHLGHLVAAAGVIGLIKATLALHREHIPGTLHFRKANPHIHFEDTPFKVSSQAQPWPRSNQVRRAGVSSFGVGGTNAHVIVEEAPQASPSAQVGHGIQTMPASAPDATAAQAASRPANGLVVWPLSAKSDAALSRRMSDLADHLQAHPDLPDAHVLATLTRGRQAMRLRHVVVAASRQDALAALRQKASSQVALNRPRVVFLFPGQGSQHPGMARGLYEHLPAFRIALDACLDLATPLLTPTDSGAADLRQWLVQADPKDERIGALLAQTRYAQPALFAMSYALTTWLDSLGVQADAMIGHSIGEYAAACKAGVMTLDAAVRAVVARGQAMYEQPPGAMLAVRADAATTQAHLAPGAEVAAENAPGLTVVAGPFGAIESMATQLEAQDIGVTRLKVSHAFHSASMDAALPRVAQALSQAHLAAPGTRLYSCVTGEPLRSEQATDPQYWARQVRASVQFRRAIEAELAQAGDTVFVEVGPSQALTALLRQYRTPQNKPPHIVPLLGPASQAGQPELAALRGLGQLWCLGVPIAWPIAAGTPRAVLPTYAFMGERHWFQRSPSSPNLNTPVAAQAALPMAAQALQAMHPPAPIMQNMSRLPRLQQEVSRIVCDVSGLPPEALSPDAPFVEMGLDSLSMTQATLEFERVFGLKMRFRRLMEDLDTLTKLSAFLDEQLPADRFAPPAQMSHMPQMPSAAQPAMAAASAAHLASHASAFTPVMPLPGSAGMPVAAGDAVHQLIQQQMQLMAQQLALLSGQAMPATSEIAAPAALSAAAMRPSAAAASALSATSANSDTTASTESAQPGNKALLEKPFGASARITLDKGQNFTPAQQRWIDDFIQRYNARTGQSKSFSQQHRKVMADPRVVTGFNPLWKDLVYPIVVNRSKGARLWDVDGNEYIDLLSCFGANLLGYQNDDVVQAMVEQLHAGIEVGPQHPLAADVAELIAEFTGMERVAFCNTGSEAVMGAMRVARTVTGRKTIAIFTNSYHGIFDEVIVRGTKQLRSLSAAPGILASAVENVLVLDWASEESLKVLRERGHELAAIMTEPIQNKYPTIQPREFIRSLRQIADDCGCALIFDEVVTGFRVAPGGAQEFYGVRADIATYGKVIGGGLPFAAIAGRGPWLDALDGGHWQYGDDSYPEAGVTYFAGTFVRHPLALAAAKASLLHLQRGGRALYQTLNERTQRMVDRLNEAFAIRGAPVKAVHCASLWRLAWDDNQKNISLFYYLARLHGLHLYEQFGHFVTEAMSDADTTRIADVFLQALDELMALGLITPRDGFTPPNGGGGGGLGHNASHTEPAPLSPGQTERWLAASFDANARRALNESFCLSLKGDVNRPALQAALMDVLQRHEAFRIRFDALEPQQVFDPATPLHIHEVDLRDQADAAAALDRFCTQASQHDFALTQAPLARVSLLQLSDGRVVVHLVASHLVFDGWASSVMLADLATAYRARSAGLAPQWAPAESPRLFAQQEQTRWDSAQAQEDQAYWKQALADAPTAISLGDRQAPTPRLFTADTIKARFEGGALLDLQAKAKQGRATLFQVTLALVAMLIQKRTGQEDMVISIPYASQGLARHGALIADGVLDLPLRLSCRTSDTFDTVLAHVKARLLDALEHPLATQGSVARALGRPASGNRPPLTGVYFNFNPRVDLSGFAPLQADMVEARKPGLLSEVIFNFYDNADALTLDLHHSTEFFSPARAQSLVDDLLAMVAPALAAPREPAATTALAQATSTMQGLAHGDTHGLSPSDWDKLQSFNATDTPYETGLRLGDLIQRGMAQHAQQVAVRFEGRSVTYAQLDDMAWAIAHQLRDMGVRPGTLVGVCLERSVELVAALLGVVYSGGAYVPLDPAYPQERLRHMGEDAAMTTIVTRSAEWARTSAAFPANARTVMLDTPPQLAPGARRDLVGSPQDPAYVIFTSGSTGRPKGAMNAHQGIVNRLQWMQQTYALTPQDKVIQKTPYSFDVSVWEFFWPLMTGATLVVAKPDGHRDASYLVQLIGGEAVTVLHFVPSMLRLFLEEPKVGTLRSIRQVVCSGEALPVDAVDRFFELLPQAQLGNLYGPTEAAVDVTCWPCRPRDPKGIVPSSIPIGRPIANTRLYVLDDNLRLLPPGAEGELYIGGVQVGMGYVARPDLTAERFLPDPFNPGGRLYKTGDIGRWLPDGVIEYLGRADHQVKLRGNRIELGEIEAQLMTLPQVARCVVVAREFGPGDVRLVAYVVARGTAPTHAQVKTHLAAHLPEYMLPQHVVALDDIPLLPNGKIDRKALPAPAEPTHAPGANWVAPRNATEQTIAGIMQAMLKVSQLGVEDDFFAMGGHSLLAARVIGQINQQLGTQLTLRALFEAPTVAKLAAMVDGPETGAVTHANRAPIVHRPDQSTAPLTLMQERIRFIEEMQPGRVVYNAPSAHRLTGLMDLQAFDRAFQEMIRRQPVLRTVIEREGDHHIQRVLDDVAFSLLPPEDLSHLPRDEREHVLNQRLEALTAQTFDLSQAPLFKARLFKLGEQEYGLFFMTHHILWDGWSFDILYTEISSLYESFLQGQAPTLAPLSITFGDYAQWHNEWLQTDELKEQVAYWTRQFATGPLPQVPYGDVPRHFATSGRGATEWMHLPQDLVDEVHGVAKQTGSTLSIVMMAVYAAMMSQWLDDTHPAIGMPFRGRATPELETIMGFFNNMLPIRLEVQPQLSCLDWIKSVRQTMVAAFASQDAPFELLARELDGQRVGAATRLYQVMFSFQDARQRQTHWGPLAHERIPLLQKGATEDLNLWMVEIPGGIEGGFQYNADLFMPGTIAALRDRFVAALRLVVKAPQQPVAALLQASAPDLDQIRAWNQGIPAAQRDNVLAQIRQQAAQAPQAKALQWGEFHLTLAQVQDICQHIATRLQAQLPPNGQHNTVAILGTHAAQTALISLAALSADLKILLLPGQPDASALQALSARGDIGAVVSHVPTGHEWGHEGAQASSHSPNPASSSWKGITASSLLACGPSWLARLEAPAIEPTDAATCAAQQAVDLDALCAVSTGLHQHVTLLASDTAFSLAEQGGNGMDLLLAVQAWTQGACWCVAPADSPSAWMADLQAAQPGLIHLRTVHWRHMLTQHHDALHATALLHVDDTPPDLLGRLFTAGATVLSVLRLPEFGLPLSGGMLHRPEDAGLCCQPWLPQALHVVNAQGQDQPIGVLGQARVLQAAQPSATLLRWRADGQLLYLGQQGHELDTVRAAPHVAPVSKSSEGASTPTQEIIAQVWESLLGIPGIGAQDNFFDLGGTSLLAMQAMTKLEALLGKRMSAQRMVFDTLAQLAAHYDDPTNGKMADARSTEPVTQPQQPPAQRPGLLKRLTGLVMRA